MGFEWDEEKDRLNIDKHGISFEEAVQVFDDVHLSRVDTREEYGEVRDITIGMTAGTVLAVVVHTDRDEAIRIISARKASKRERTSIMATVTVDGCNSTSGPSHHCTSRVGRDQRGRAPGHGSTVPSGASQSTRNRSHSRAPREKMNELRATSKRLKAYRAAGICPAAVLEDVPNFGKSNGGNAAPEKHQPATAQQISERFIPPVLSRETANEAEIMGNIREQNTEDKVEKVAFATKSRKQHKKREK